MSEDRWQAFEAEVNRDASSPGFYVFLGLLCLPALVAFAIFLGAWLVSGEVSAAEAASERSGTVSEAQDVAGWKKALVGVCPVH